MSANLKFRYPPLKTPTQIRVVKIIPSNNAQFRCYLTVIDLNEDPKVSTRIKSLGPESIPLATPSSDHFRAYVALSYVWGDQSRLHEIYLDDQPFLVGHNLMTALKSLSRPGVDFETFKSAISSQEKIPCFRYPNLPEERYFWIDAICINQCDIDEREAQVKLMARIYTQALLVHVELGYDPDEDSTDLLDLLQKIITAANHIPNTRERPTDKSDTPTSRPDLLGPNNHGTLEDHGIPSFDDPIWGNLHRFLQTPYFSRVWILQEFVLPRIVAVSVGDALINPENVARCVELLNTYTRRKQLYLFPANKSYEESWKVDVLGREFQMHAFLWRSLFHYPPSDIPSCNFSKFQRLVHVVSYSRGANASDPRDMLYSKLALASDAKAFTHLITYSRSTEEVFFSFAKRFIELGQGIELLYNIDSESSVHKGLPSWIPDWNRRTYGISMIYGPAMAPVLAYAASQLVPSQLVVQGPTLVVNGGVFDSVVHTTQSVHNATEPPVQSIAKFILQGISLLHRVRQYPGNQHVEDLFVRTLVFDDQKVHKRDNISRQRELVRNMMENRPQEIWLEHWTRLSNEGFRFAVGRVFCVTKNGYLGFVPAGARNGDQVCLFYGGSVPFVIRPLGGGKYRLLGHAYFHGLMHGEAFDLESFKGQKIVLT